MTTHVAIYARQSEDVAEGIDRQLTRCKALIEARGWTLAEVYEDNATSASKARTKDWARMLHDAKAGAFTHVVAVDVDRLLRSITDLSALFEAELRVVTVDGEIDTASADGEFRATMLAGLARFEVRRKAERTKRANDQRRTKGVPTSGRPPYGWAWVPAGGRTDGFPWRDVPDEQAVVRDAYERVLSGETLGSICATLNAAGTATKTGAEWRPTTLRRTLLSPFYAGLLPEPRRDGTHYDPAKVDPDRCLPASWEPLVDRGVWLAVRGLLLDGGRRTNGGATARKWLLSGLATCSVCGDPVRSSVTRESHRGYRCRSEAHFQRRAEPVDEFVEDAILVHLERPAFAAAFATTDDGRDLKGEAGELRSRMDELALAYANSAVTLSQMTTATEALRAMLAAVEKELADRAGTASLGALVTTGDVREAWDRLPLEGKRTVIRTLAEVVLHPTGRGNGRYGVTPQNVEVRWL